jgi:hypothetical protein
MHPRRFPPAPSVVTGGAVGILDERALAWDDSRRRRVAQAAGLATARRSPFTATLQRLDGRLVLGGRPDPEAAVTGATGRQGRPAGHRTSP